MTLYFLIILNAFSNNDFLQRPFWDMMYVIFITPVFDVAVGPDIFHLYYFLRFAKGNY